jgi:hypothetical protein
MAAGRSKALALANGANCFVTLAAAPIGFYLWGLEGFVMGWTLGNLCAVVIVDIELSKEGIDLMWQDAILTLFVLAFLITGFALQNLFSARFAWNDPEWLSELLPPALLSIIAGAAMYRDYRNSALAYSSVFGREMATTVNP